MVHMLLSQALVVGALFVYASFFEWILHRFVMQPGLVDLVSFPEPYTDPPSGLPQQCQLSPAPQPEL